MAPPEGGKVAPPHVRTVDLQGGRPRAGRLARALTALAAALLAASGAPARAGAPKEAPGAAPSREVQLTPEEDRELAAHRGAIRVGITVIPPQVLRADGTYEGLSIDYLHVLERKLGCRFELVPYGTWNEVIEAAKRREIDMIFAAQRTPERAAYLRFSEPYVELPNMILVRKDREGGADLRDMKGWSVAVSEGSAVHELLRREHPQLQLRPVRDELAGLMRVSMGEVDAMVVEISRASYYIERAGILNLRVSGNAGFVYELRFAVRSDWPVLAAILDRGLSAVTAEERRTIARRWIVVGERNLLASRAFRAWAGAGLAGVMLLLAGVFAWNRALRRMVRQRTSLLMQELAERKRAEQESALTSFALDNVHEAAFLIDEGARFRFVNEEACRALGYTRAELLGLGVADVDPEFPLERWPAHWAELKARRALLFEGHHRAKDGRLLPVEIAANYLEYGGHAYNLALVRDITERRRAEAERLWMEEQLRQSQKLEAVGKLAGGVAHDFNNLLTAIMGSAEELASRLDAASPLREGVQDIQDAAQRASLLTRQLLAFGRKQPIRPRLVDLGEVVGSTLRMLRRLIGEDVELTTASEPGLGRVLIDPGAVEQVILNLAVNARDAMPAGGRLTIRTASVLVTEDEARGRAGVRPGPHVLLVVADTGTGMSPEVQSHLFEPFFTTKGVGKGTGLGLSTVYGIVKQCGGDIHVESAPDRGTVFRIYLPCAEGAAAPEEASPAEVAAGAGEAAPGPASARSGSVLVVEDEPAVRSVALRALRGAGFTVCVAADGDEALRLLGEARGPAVDLVVTDVVMPRLGGLELAARLRERRPGLPVLFVSGYTEHAADLQGRLDERTTFLSKPFTPQDLLRAVRQLLERREVPTPVRGGC